MLRKALARWPMVPASNPGQRARGLLVHSPEMRRFVRDILGMADKLKGGMNAHALLLLKEGGRECNNRNAGKHNNRAGRIRNAVAELVTKYRLGADGNECMAALAKFYEEITPNANT